mmetsp:Transcript_11911/g.29110  ORF Transcript_11911/g.29110 Transcript_11911/m.29110 type:complete len:250 (-) Transcript_11911:1084-1833(-)
MIRAQLRHINRSDHNCTGSTRTSHCRHRHRGFIIATALGQPRGEGGVAVVLSESNITGLIDRSTISSANLSILTSTRDTWQRAVAGAARGKGRRIYAYAGVASGNARSVNAIRQVGTRRHVRRPEYRHLRHAHFVVQTVAPFQRDVKVIRVLAFQYQTITRLDSSVGCHCHLRNIKRIDLGQRRQLSTATHHAHTRAPTVAVHVEEDAGDQHAVGAEALGALGRAVRLHHVIVSTWRHRQRCVGHRDRS